MTPIPGTQPWLADQLFIAGYELSVRAAQAHTTMDLIAALGTAVPILIAVGRDEAAYVAARRAASLARTVEEFAPLVYRAHAYAAYPTYRSYLASPLDPRD